MCIRDSLEALAFIDMQQGDEDRLVLDKLSAHSTKEYPATAFVQVELDEMCIRDRFKHFNNKRLKHNKRNSKRLKKKVKNS